MEVTPALPLHEINYNYMILHLHACTVPHRTKRNIINLLDPITVSSTILDPDFNSNISTK